jgi:hypothetical protein
LPNFQRPKAEQWRPPWAEKVFVPTPYDQIRNSGADTSIYQPDWLKVLTTLPRIDLEIPDRQRLGPQNMYSFDRLELDRLFHIRSSLIAITAIQSSGTVIRQRNI